MKDVCKLKNYREKYKRYYGIEFGKEFEVHHMDFDRENDDISNLLLLPKELHQRYHALINAISISVDKPKADGFINVRLSNDLVTEFCACAFGCVTRSNRGMQQVGTAQESELPKRTDAGWR